MPSPAKGSSTTNPPPFSPARAPVRPTRQPTCSGLPALRIILVGLPPRPERRKLSSLAHSSSLSPEEEGMNPLADALVNLLLISLILLFIFFRSLREGLYPDREIAHPMIRAGRRKGLSRIEQWRAAAALMSAMLFAGVLAWKAVNQDRQPKSQPLPQRIARLTRNIQQSAMEMDEAEGSAGSNHEGAASGGVCRSSPLLLRHLARAWAEGPFGGWAHKSRARGRAGRRRVVATGGGRGRRRR